MTKQELFKKYSINDSHNIWDTQIDSWMSIEIYRIMHEGKLPPEGDLSIKWVREFLDKTDDMKFMSKLMARQDWGSLYLTSKRMMYRFADKILA